MIISRPVHTLTIVTGALVMGAAGSFFQVPAGVCAAAAPRAIAMAKNRGLRHRAAISSESFIIALTSLYLPAGPGPYSAQVPHASTPGQRAGRRRTGSGRFWRHADRAGRRAARPR